MAEAAEYTVLVPDTNPDDILNQPFQEFDESDHFVTQSTFRHPDSDDSDVGIDLDNDFLNIDSCNVLKDFESDITTIPSSVTPKPDKSLSKSTVNDTTPSSSQGLVSKLASSSLLTPPPKAIGSLPVSSPLEDPLPSNVVNETVTEDIGNFVIPNILALTPQPNVCDTDVMSSDDDELLISAVKGSSRSSHLHGLSVANPKSQTSKDPDDIDFTNDPPCPFSKPKISRGNPIEKTAEKIFDSSSTNAEQHSRFHKSTPSEVDNLQYNAKAPRTHLQTQWGIRIFKEWCKFSGYSEDFESVPAAELGERMSRFYCELRQKDGTRYSRSSLLCIRASLNRHLVNAPFNRAINIMSDSEFAKANSVITGTIKKAKRRGEDVSERHSPISVEDVRMLYTTHTLSNDTPTTLQHKVFFEMCLHFCRRGREGLRDLSKDDIIFCNDPSGAEYATLSHNPYEKNHASVSHHEGEHIQKMYSTKAEDCPVQSLKLYLSKLNPDSPHFFQRPKTRRYEKSQIWYQNSPVGVNKIGKMMVNMSETAGLSKRYTNHCIRATAITVLRDKGVDKLDIKSVSGHRSTASIDSYSKTDHTRREEMSNMLSEFLGKKVENNPKRKVENSTTELVENVEGTMRTLSSIPEYVPPPIAVVNPSPRKIRTPLKSFTQPIPVRRSPQLEAKSLDHRLQKSLPKKLTFEQMGELPPKDRSQGRGPTIIIKGGTNIIHYH